MAKNSKLPGWPDMMATPFAGFAQGMGAPASPGNPLAQSLTNGMDFMKSLWGGMPSTVPGFVVPTVDIGELDKRIEDLRAVESWLALNANMLKATIQGLEVQRNTLAALKALGEKGDFLQAAMQKGFAPSVAAAAGAPAVAPGVNAFEQLFGQASVNANWPLGAKASEASSATATAVPVVTPMSEVAPPEEILAAPKQHKQRHKKVKKGSAAGHAAPSTGSAASSVAAQSANMWMNFLKDQFGQIASAALAKPGASGVPAKTAPSQVGAPPKARRPAAKKATRKRATAKSPARTRS